MSAMYINNSFGDKRFQVFFFEICPSSQYPPYICLFDLYGILTTLGCIILPKVIEFIDSPLNPIIWTTNSSPSEKFLKNFHKQGPPLRGLGYVYAVWSKALPRKSFCLKILLAMLKMTRFLKIFHYHGPKFEKKIWFELCHQWGRISGGLKTAKNGLR